jgi:hydroxyacylglutathione hydrolase
LEIQTFHLTPFIMNCYVLRDGGEAVIIDPGEKSDAVLAMVENDDLKMILNTHCHIDHCGGNAAMKAATGAPIAIHERELPLLQGMDQQAMMFGVPCTPSPDPDTFLEEGGTIQVGSAQLKVLHAPGHSPGHVVFAGDGFVIAGDVLFAGSIGRTDLPGGSHEQLIDSIRTKLLTLPDETVVYCGHGPETTIGRERRSNPFLVQQ